MFRPLILFLMLVTYLIAPQSFAQEKVPQWRSLSLEATEGGSSSHQFKGSALTAEQNQGKFFYGLEMQRNYDEQTETELSSYSFLAGYQPDWTLGVEPRASLSAGIARGTEKGSVLSLKLEGDQKLGRNFYLTFGIKLTSLQGAGPVSGGYQSTFIGIRFLAF